MSIGIDRETSIKLVISEFDRLGVKSVTAYTDNTVFPSNTRMERSVEIEGPKSGKRRVVLMIDADGGDPDVMVSSYSYDGAIRDLEVADLVKLGQL